MPILDIIKIPCQYSRLCRHIPLVLSIFLLFSSNQTSSFAESRVVKDGFSTEIDAQHFVKVIQQTNHQHKSRYVVNLYDRSTEQSLSALIRPVFGKITDVYVEDDRLVVMMEILHEKQQLLVFDSYHIAKDPSGDAHLQPERKFPLGNLKTHHNVFNRPHQMPDKLSNASGYAIIERF